MAEWHVSRLVTAEDLRRDDEEQRWRTVWVEAVATYRSVGYGAEKYARASIDMLRERYEKAGRTARIVETGQAYRDYVLEVYGTLEEVRLPPIEDVREWAEEHIPAEAFFGRIAFVAEHRYADDIIEGMLADGLELT